MDYFKVHRCPIEKQHNFKRCIYFHNELDRRRDPTKYFYGSEFCGPKRATDFCELGDACRFAHTKVEQAYHQDKYRNKFCNHYPDALSNCPYGKYCSYAHSEEEIRADMLENYKKDADFFLFQFKTRFCPYSKCEDRSKCIYAHNWQDFRRDPSKYLYRSESCPYWDPKKKVSSYDTACPKGIQCTYCHGRSPTSSRMEGT